MTPRFSEWRRLFRVFTARPGVTVGCIILLLFVLIAVFARWLAPNDPNQIDLINIMLTPGSEGHLLGTDLLGRDILSRLIYGARVALFVSFVTTLLSAAIGITFGTIAGYFGGWVNTIIMRITQSIKF